MRSDSPSFQLVKHIPSISSLHCIEEAKYASTSLLHDLTRGEASLEMSKVTTAFFKEIEVEVEKVLRQRLRLVQYTKLAKLDLEKSVCQKKGYSLLDLKLYGGSEEGGIKIPEPQEKINYSIVDRKEPDGYLSSSIVSMSSSESLHTVNSLPGATLDMERLQKLVTSLMHHKYGFEFSQKVGLDAYPDYDESTCIFRPMDLGTILR